MKAMKFFTVIALAMMSVFTITSCDNDNDVYWYYPPYPNALVTVKPVSDNGFTFSWMTAPRCSPQT